MAFKVNLKKDPKRYKRKRRTRIVCEKLQKNGN